MFWKKKKKEPEKKARIILGMILLNNNQPFDLESLKKDHFDYYDLQINAEDGDGSTVVFNLDGDMVAVSHMPVPVPQGDIEATAQYAYNWPTALEDLRSHQSHIMLTILNGTDNQVLRYATFTMLACSLLRTTDAVGVYMGSQSLLIPKDDYLESAAAFSEDMDTLPIHLWVYFGLRQYEGKNSGYTYGLTEFGKMEMEVVESDQSLEDIREFLFNLAHYVVQNDVTFHDGETCGLNAEQKIKITVSKARFVEGKSFKLNF